MPFDAAGEPRRRPARERSGEPRKARPSMVQRLVECRHRVSPVDAFAVPDQQVLRLESAERVARRREPEQQVNAGPIRSCREEPVRADRLGDDERPLGRPPECRLAPAPGALHHDDLEWAVRNRVRNDEVRDAELARDRGTVAVVPVEQLKNGARLADFAGAGERGLVADRVDEPDAPAGRKRVRRPGRGLVDEPREAGCAAVVAEADAHHERLRGRLPSGLNAPNRPQGHPDVPGVTVAVISSPVCADFVPRFAHSSRPTGLRGALRFLPT